MSAKLLSREIEGTIGAAPRGAELPRNGLPVEVNDMFNSCLEENLCSSRSLRRRTVLPRFSAVLIPYAVAVRQLDPYMLGVRSRRIFWRADS